MNEYKATKTIVSEVPLMLHEIRHWRQLPLFLSADAVRVIQWARTLPGEPGARSKPERKPGTFSIADLMGFLYPDKRGPVRSDDPRRLHAEEIMHELSAANMRSDAGYFQTRINYDMADIVPEPCRDCVVPL
jgi:hypothetical protein